MVLCVSFEDIQQGLSEDQLRHLKKTGVIVIQGGVPREVRNALEYDFFELTYPDKQEASSWLEALKQYIAINADKVKGWYTYNYLNSRLALSAHFRRSSGQARVVRAVQLSISNCRPHTSWIARITGLSALPLE